MRTRFRALALGGAAVAVMFGSALPAGADASSLTVTPDPVVAGEVVTVSGAGCGGIGAMAMIGIFSGDLEDPIALESAEPDENGDWSVDITLPEDLAPGAFEVLAYCDASYDGYNGTEVDGFDYESTTVDVLAAGVAAPVTPVSGSRPGTAPSGTLARTGSNSGNLALAGLALALTGGALFALSKRNKVAGPTAD